MHGLAACDTCRRARRWLDARGVSFSFRDVRDDPPGASELRRWAAAAGWERLLNRRSTTWRGLPTQRKDALDPEGAVRLMAEYPTLVKRPVLEAPGGLAVGFDETAWRRLVGA